MKLKNSGISYETSYSVIIIKTVTIKFHNISSCSNHILYNKKKNGSCSCDCGKWMAIYIYIYIYFFFFPIFFSSCHVVNIFSLCEFPKLIQLKFHYQEFKFTVIRFYHEIAKWIDIVRFSVGKSMTIYLVLCCNLEYQISSIRSCPRSSSKERSLWS